LFESAQQTDAANLMALEAQRREAAAEARSRERKRQYDKLHDTVLHTLENISRGVWDIQGRQARENCERDAEYLRGLISGGMETSVAVGGEVEEGRRHNNRKNKRTQESHRG